ncbi:MAG: tRNA (adenosine(37)-N6)-threonylcarbamoyltransferase complex transferase subunit TsaD [Candidatus Omnitrophica bacterium]|nr:tRNA (adenosine(37)-N6)-threonylcarbamoyltransferase complex transferase subunit TsaD [Candidatus Omnitrophota bacterium]
MTKRNGNEQPQSAMYTLGIETSCDETSCAVLKNYRVLSNVTISSLREHAKYGGVVPEIATRLHLKNIDKVTRHALTQAGVSLNQIDLIAATHTPGLIGALVVGLNFAQALSLSLRKPFIGVNHLHAHIFAPFLNNAHPIEFPFLGLVVSGGHTEIYYVKDFTKISLIGKTRDDACGEVFDKVAKAYGLGYPGGPAIDRLFNAAHKNDFSFKCGKIGFDLSFSGIKTALVYKKLELEKQKSLDRATMIGLISSFQEIVLNTIVSTVLEAARTLKVRRVVCGGGVIANRSLRRKLSARASANLQFLIPPFEYTTDNAGIVAGLGFYLYNKKSIRSSLGLEPEAN